MLCTLQLAASDNATVEIISPLKTSLNFTVTHEKIIVPVEPIEKEPKVETPVTEIAIESNVKKRPKTKYSVEGKTSTTTAATPVKRSPAEGVITRPSPTQSTQAPIRRSSSGLNVWTTTVTPFRSSASLRVWSTTPASTVAQPVKRNSRNYDDGRGNYQISHDYSSVARHPQKPAQYHKSSRNAGPNQIQPLHIDTDVFKKKHAMSSGSIKPTKHQQNRIKLHNLPENPGTDIPATDWFDNLGKYHYGIVHDELYFTEPPEYAVQTQKPHGKVIDATPAPPPQVFRSSFRDPQYIPPIIQPVVENDHLGKFLYKTEVHYPTYRNHLYPPVTVYSNHAAPATKELPVPSAHPRPPPPGPPRKGESKPPQPQSKQQQEDEEDYDEDSSEDYDDGTGNDRYDGDPPGDDDEGEGDGEESTDDESGSEEKAIDRPRYRFGSGDSNSGESDEFERAWSKFGYGKDKGSGSDESGSYESSETRNVPQRVKFFHEVKEEVTTPHRHSTTETPPKRIKFYHEVKEEISTPRRSTTTEAPVKLRRITKVVSGKLNHSKFKTTTPKVQPKPKLHPTVPPKRVKSQESEAAEKKSERSDAAGSDDLKFFQ